MQPTGSLIAIVLTKLSPGMQHGHDDFRRWFARSMHSYRHPTTTILDRD